METPEALAGQLVQFQNADGGWGYKPGHSWTEPTAFALLALESFGGASRELKRGRDWLISRQRADGGWAPADVVETSTWVTGPAVLALASAPNCSALRARARDWLSRQLQPSYSLLQLCLRRLHGLPVSEDVQGGSAWFPGTAAWVTPTALAILALRNLAREGGEQLNAKIQGAQKFLLSRRCADGGWNHGGSRYHSEGATSYPETTGAALLALAGSSEAELRASLVCAENLLRHPESSEGLSWLRLGLAVHGRPALALNSLRSWNAREASLELLAWTAASPTNRLTGPAHA